MGGVTSGFYLGTCSKDSVASRLCAPPLPGSPLEPLAFARIFLAHTIKWPPLVRRWTVATADSKTAADLVGAYVDILRNANGHAFTTMHAGMSSGRMHAETGVIAHAKQLKLLLTARKAEEMQASCELSGEVPTCTYKC